MTTERTVLIVDDSKVSRMMIKALISESHKGWTLLEAANAEDALVVANKNRVDFYSIDFNMPGKTGLELIAELKSIYPDSKYALLTANIQEHIRNATLDVGAQCFKKPITEKSIGEILRYFNE